MHQYLLRFGLLAPAVFVTALVPRSTAPVAFVSFDDLVVYKSLSNSLDGSSSMTSTTTPPSSTTTLSVSNTTDSVGLPSIDATPSAVPSNSSDKATGSATEAIPWRNGLTAYISEASSERFIGYERALTLLWFVLQQLADKPPDGYPSVRGVVLSDRSLDNFHMQNEPQSSSRPPAELTYGDIIEFINDILLPHINRLHATSVDVNGFDWIIRPTDPEEDWDIATGSVYSRP